jgi:hypothetical protein
LKRQLGSIADINLDIHAHHLSYDPDKTMPRLTKISALPDLSIKLKPFKSPFLPETLMSPAPKSKEPPEPKLVSVNAEKLEPIDEKSEYHEHAIKAA